MTEERRKVLEMLAEGKISASDAERLLDKLGATADEAGEQASADSASKSSSGARAWAWPGFRSSGNAQKPRYLRIMVERPDEKDHVNIRIPLAFARTGSRLLSVLPHPVAEKLSAQGIDLGVLTSLTGEDLEETLRDLNMDIEKGDGRKVKIFCE